MSTRARPLRVFLAGISLVLIRPLLRLALAFFILGAVLTGACLLLAWKYRRETLRVRFEGRPSFEGLGIAYLRDNPNLSARRLEVLAAQLGVRLAPSAARNRPTPDTVLAAREKGLKPELGATLDGFLERADDEPPHLSPGVVDFISTHRADLEAIRRHVLTAPTPLWEVGIDSIDAPLPNFLGFMTLVRLLALQASADPDPSCTDAWLEAAWRLNESLLERPELIAFLIHRANDSLVHRLVRTLPAVSGDWGPRLSRRDPMEAEILGLRWEAPILVREFYRGLAPTGGRLGETVRASARPYLEMCGWEHALRMQALAGKHSTLSYCELTPERLEEIWRPSTPRWNVLSKVAWPELAPTTVRALRRRLDQELTALVLLERVNALESDQVASRACRGNVWTIVRRPSGLTIELGKRVFDPVKKPLARELSLRFVKKANALREPRGR